jgi:hypothetical protein
VSSIIYIDNWRYLGTCSSRLLKGGTTNIYGQVVYCQIRTKRIDKNVSLSVYNKTRKYILSYKCVHVLYCHCTI